MMMVQRFIQLAVVISLAHFSKAAKAKHGLKQVDCKKPPPNKMCKGATKELVDLDCQKPPADMMCLKDTQQLVPAIWEASGTEKLELDSIAYKFIQQKLEVSQEKASRTNAKLARMKAKKFLVGAESSQYADASEPNVLTMPRLNELYFKDRMYKLVQWSGYSADWMDETGFFLHAAKLMFALGPNTIHVGSFTRTGVGKVELVFNALRNNTFCAPNIANTLLGGLVSRQALNTEEAITGPWGPYSDPHQKLDFAVFGDSDGWAIPVGGGDTENTWTIKWLLDANEHYAGRPKEPRIFQLFYEGGEIALKEGRILFKHVQSMRFDEVDKFQNLHVFLFLDFKCKMMENPAFRQKSPDKLFYAATGLAEDVRQYRNNGIVVPPGVRKWFNENVSIIRYKAMADPVKDPAEFEQCKRWLKDLLPEYCSLAVVEPPLPPKIGSYEALMDYYFSGRYKMVQWSGYSFMYEQQDELLNDVEDIVRQFGANTVHVTTVTGEGIGAVEAVVNKLAAQAATEDVFGGVCQRIVVGGMVAEGATEKENLQYLRVNQSLDFIAEFKSVNHKNRWSLIGKDGKPWPVALVEESSFRMAQNAPHDPRIEAYQVFYEGGPINTEQIHRLVDDTSEDPEKFKRLRLFLFTGWDKTTTAEADKKDNAATKASLQIKEILYDHWHIAKDEYTPIEASLTGNLQDHTTLDVHKRDTKLPQPEGMLSKFWNSVHSFSKYGEPLLQKIKAATLAAISKFVAVPARVASFGKWVKGHVVELRRNGTIVACAGWQKILFGKKCVESPAPVNNGSGAACSAWQMLTDPKKCASGEAEVIE